MLSYVKQPNVVISPGAVLEDSTVIGTLQIIDPHLVDLELQPYFTSPDL